MIANNNATICVRRRISEQPLLVDDVIDGDATRVDDNDNDGM
jgi:hypothetical protein